MEQGKREASHGLPVPSIKSSLPELRGSHVGDPSTEIAKDTRFDGDDEGAGRTLLRPSQSYPLRPELKNKAVGTERTRPIHQRTTWLGLRRRATAGEAVNMSPSREDRTRRDSTSSSESSYTDDEASIRSWAMPNNRHTHMSQLNQIHGQSWSRHGSKEQSCDRSDGNGQPHSTSKLGPDGRLAIGVHDMLNSGHLAKALGLSLQHRLGPLQRRHDDHEVAPPETKPPITTSQGGIPRMNVVIMVIGSRGDVQPFIKIGKTLQEKHGHRVRIATHPVFREFVQRDSGLEFFSVGGDPSELMAFMVKNPGLIPSMETLRAGEIGRRRESMYEMFQGFWRACVNATDEEKDTANLEMMGDVYPFIADAIIANPPSFAHFHCAERLGIPLHLVFTFPYTPTQQFPHPLANIAASHVDANYTNFMSYPLVELMTWQGLGDLVNRFRVKTLGLEPMSTLWAPGQLFRLKVPYTYLWSPGLVPKPADWGPEIDIAGYVFLDLATGHQPAAELLEFLAAGEQPIYIGFGSISGVDDPDAFTHMVFGAVEKSNVRAIISKGWGDMGRGMVIPDNILLVDNVPHDWLFPRVRAVVHHGGAGTTACGLRFGKPTMIVPFFGDQPFWGAMVVKAHAGAEHCLPLKKLTVDSFAEGIRQCLANEARHNAEEIAECIKKDGDGAENAVNSFHRALPLDGHSSLRCVVFPDRVAVWRYKKTPLQLSALAAHLLVQKASLQWRDLWLLRHYEWDDFQGPGEPITGIGGAVFSDVREILGGLSSITHRAKRGLKSRERQKRRKQGRTVANAVAIPGRTAQERVRLSMDPAEQVEHKPPNMDEFNLHGNAAPPAKRWRHTTPQSMTLETDSQNGLGVSLPSGPVPPKEIPNPPSAPAIVLRAGVKGISHSSKVLIRLPIDMWYAAALGLHNAPRLYGDSTVRPPPGPITGFRSGGKVAGIGLVHGLSDGLIGLVRLPRHDMKEKGRVGFLVGFGKGMGGLVVKPTCGVVGLAGYTGKGFEVGVRKRVRDTRRTDRWIRRAQINQGEKDLRRLKEREGDDKDSEDDEVQKATSHALHVWSAHQKHEAEMAAQQQRSKAPHLKKPKQEVG